jgi:hypothetical protein
MTLSASQIAAKYSIMPGRISVTYYASLNDDLFDAAVTIDNVEAWAPGGPTRTQDAGTIAFPVSPAVFRMWTSQMSGVEPKTGDKLVDDEGVIWMVDDAGSSLLGQRWMLTCTQAKDQG